MSPLLFRQVRVVNFFTHFLKIAQYFLEIEKYGHGAARPILSHTKNENAKVVILSVLVVHFGAISDTDLSMVKKRQILT